MIRSRLRALSLLLGLVACAADVERGSGSTDSDKRQLSGTSYLHPDADLHELQSFFLPVLESNRKEFRGQTGLVRGFGAGARYPQIWLRDSATLTSLTRYYYPRDYHTSWLEEHLSHQDGSGALNDWIAAGEVTHFTAWAPKARQIYRAGNVVLTADKNTTEADQEASAVVAAATVFDLFEDQRWLGEKILKRSILTRLDDALAYVLRERTDPGLGLVVNAFTADWGDVSPIYADQRAIYLDENTPRVAGLYTNALVFGAALDLSRLHRVVGDHVRADHWEKQAESIRKAVNEHLWEPAEGFYKLHHIVSAYDRSSDYDDSSMFALGGNALAVLHGLATDEQAARIFAVAEARRLEYGIGTVAATLLPPYPSGYFDHPVLSDEYNYQNGGQWDWFAGRFVLAEFERGYSEAAREHLRQIARRVRRNGGLYEWYTREGDGRGSQSYAGSAGALGAAVFGGLYGIDLDHEGVCLDVRLGSQAGSVRVEEPATGRFVSYVFEPSKEMLLLEYQSSKPVNRIGILLSPHTRVLEAKLDEEPVEIRLLERGEDRYATLTPRHETGRIELRIARTETLRSSLNFDPVNAHSQVAYIGGARSPVARAPRLGAQHDKMK